MPKRGGTARTVWAWRPGRARKIAAFLDHLLALLPFEPPYFEREGLPCTFVGHSIVEGEAASGDGTRFRAYLMAVARHELFEITANIQLEGDFDAAYCEGDNRNCVATDTMKNFILREALQYERRQLKKMRRVS